MHTSLIVRVPSLLKMNEFLNSPCRRDMVAHSVHMTDTTPHFENTRK